MASGNDRGDDTDDLVRRWASVVPGIDPRVEGVVDRLLICARYLDRLAATLAAEHDIQFSDYEILARLFWVGEPHRLRPSQLAAGTMTAATTITSRLDRLQRRGLISRVPDPTDRRAMAAELTDEGGELFTRIVERQAEAERRIFGDVSPARLDRLAGLLSETLTVLERHLGPPPRRVRLALSED
ncbi:MarR family transcriptional regulator [Stackebrandtia albiflava]|uniref:MarR family transcriptional regulator n=1 Tax=Stackebrandtia albiflava TaxID=406432 RepID=A0A562V3N5_9ACTN|nr:MarR family transcriptional regulator [Stackebrandtia albiflava]TWJ12473.1 MarR family transcriptional regulator [Stackebrandtia albiflava]